MSDEVVNLVPTKSDAEVAVELKQKMEEAMKPVCAIMDEAVAHKLVIRFQGIMAGPPYMRHQVIGLEVVKVFS